MGKWGHLVPSPHLCNLVFNTHLLCFFRRAHFGSLRECLRSHPSERSSALRSALANIIYTLEGCVCIWCVKHVTGLYVNLICAWETSVCQINLNNARLHFHDQCLMQNANMYLSVHQLWLYVRTHRPILIVAMETECCQRSPHSKRPSLSLCFHSPTPAASVFRSAPLHFYASCLSVRFFLCS